MMAGCKPMRKGGSVKRYAKGGDVAGRRFNEPKGMNKSMPSLKEDVVEATKRDIGKAKTGLSSQAQGAARAAQQQAGGRAVTRMAGRAGAAGAALQGGMAIGEALRKVPGVDEGVKKAVAPVVDRATKTMDEARGRGGVKLSADSERRLANERIKPVGSSEMEAPAAKAAQRPAAKAAQRPAAKPAPRLAAEPAPDMGVREGRNVNIDEGTRQRAREAVGMKKGGKVRGAGIAKRGMGRGMMR